MHVRLGCPSTEVPGNRGGQGWRVAWVVREPRAKATPPSQRRSPGGYPRRAFGATAPPLTEGTGGALAPGGPERAPRRVHPCAPPDAALMHTGVDAR